MSINIGGKKFTGSGFLLIDKKGIILGRYSEVDNIVYDLGGDLTNDILSSNLSYEKKLLLNASDNLYKKTIGVIYIDIDEKSSCNNFIDFKIDNNNYYRCFIIYIDNMIHDLWEIVQENNYSNNAKKNFFFKYDKEKLYNIFKFFSIKQIIVGNYFLQCDNSNNINFVVRSFTTTGRLLKDTNSPPLNLNLDKIFLKIFSNPVNNTSKSGLHYISNEIENNFLKFEYSGFYGNNNSKQFIVLYKKFFNSIQNDPNKFRYFEYLKQKNKTGIQNLKYYYAKI